LRAIPYSGEETQLGDLFMNTTLARSLMLLVSLFTLPCWAGVIFEESFDAQPDWNVTGALNKDCGINCTDAPRNWNNYYAVPPVGSLATTIRSIPDGSADHTGRTAKKAYMAYYNNVQYSGGAELSKTFPQDYPELYMRVWIKTQPGWQTAANSSIKLFRAIHYDRTGSAFAYFAGGNGAPMAGMNWATNSTYRSTNGIPDGCYIAWFRCDPQSSNYYCSQSPYNVDTPQRMISGIAPDETGGFADGRWHRYDVHVKMNTQTGSTWNQNGIYEFSYDGIPVVSYTNVQWKYPGSNTGVGWNTVQFGGNNLNAYTGGSNPQWAAFDDIVVSTTPIPDNYVIGDGIVDSGDRTAPTVALTSPANNSTVSGMVTIAANATDNIAVTRVEFYIDSALDHTVTTPPYSYSVDTSAVPEGTYILSAKAYDSAGNIGQSANVSTTVSRSLPDTSVPVVNIFTMPTTSTSLTVPVSAFTASDAVGIAGYKITESSTRPLASSSGWTPTVPTSFTFSAAGARTAYAWAKDAAGNVSASLSRNITITLPAPSPTPSPTPTVTPDTTAPSVSITSPASGSFVRGTVTFAVSANDNVGVKKVELFRNGVLVATDTTAPYSFDWNSNSVKNGSYVFTAKASDAAGNIRTSTGVNITVYRKPRPPTNIVVN